MHSTTLPKAHFFFFFRIKFVFRIHYFAMKCEKSSSLEEFPVCLCLSEVQLTTLIPQLRTPWHLPLIDSQACCLNNCLISVWCTGTA